MLRTYNSLDQYRMADGTLPGLMTSSIGYKPFRYEWAHAYWLKQQQVHWLPEEVPLGEDIKDWTGKLDDKERNLLTQIFRFFTQADVEVQDNYMERYSRVFKPTEVKMMLAAFANMECFDADTELLTTDGWKRCPDISESDRLAQYDLDTGAISFVRPKKVVSYPYRGTMHHYSSKTTDICVTPNHDLIAINPHTRKRRKVKSFAYELGGNFLYPSAGKAIGELDEPTPLDRLLIAVQADGNLRGLAPSEISKKSNSHTVTFILHKLRKINRLHKLLHKCGLKFKEKREGNKRVKITFNLPLDIDLHTIKNLGFLDLASYSAKGARKVIEEILCWDGSVNAKTQAYYNTNKAAIDRVQAFAVLAGISTQLGVNRTAEQSMHNTLPNGQNPKSAKTCYILTFSDRVERTYPHAEEVEYDDRVYCVSVPTENLVSRRNGKVACTGNTVHVAAYALLLETIGMPETEFSAFMEYDALRAKHDYMQTFGVGSHADIARTLAMFGGFTEGLQLFASFAMLMNFPRFNRMKGMGQIVSWSIRDESLHCDGIIQLYHAFNHETGAVTKSVADDIVDCCKTSVALEDRFIDLAFEAGEVKGMTPDDIKAYIRFIANWRLRQLKLPEVYDVPNVNPLDWLQPLLSGVEHANFFEARATEYSKGATKGQWHGEDGVWGEFDRLLVNRANKSVF